MSEVIQLILEHRFLKWITPIVAATSLFYVYRRLWKMRFFLSRGIKTPPNNFLFGNTLDCPFDYLQEFYEENTKKLGRTWGFFEGPTPHLVISRLADVKKVLVQDFAIFHERKLFPLFIRPDSKDIDVFSTNGIRWKRHRYVVSPSFTAHKLKLMSPLIDKCDQMFIEKCQELAAKNESVDIILPISALSSGIIAECAFGIKLESGDKPNPVVQEIEKIGEVGWSGIIMALFGLAFAEIEPFFERIDHYIPIYFNAGLKSILYPLIRFAGLMVQQRKDAIAKGEPTRNDIMQMLLDAETKQPINDSATMSPIAGEIPDRKLHFREIAGNVAVMLLAGHSTSLSTISSFIYEIARRPDIQDRLYEEIHAMFESRDENAPETLTYDEIVDLKYLDQCIHETLRLNCPVPFAIQRRSSAPFEIDGVQYPSGTNVVIEARALSRDREIWGEDADTFNPDRFSGEQHAARDPVAFVAFGGGPRKCVGQRMALLSAKMCACYFINQFKVELDEEKQKDHMRPIFRDSVRFPKVFVKMTKRE